MFMTSRDTQANKIRTVQKVDSTILTQERTVATPFKLFVGPVLLPFFVFV